MRCPPEVTCIVCQLVFCCGDCRWRHEQNTHGLTFDCPLCRGGRFLCRPDQLLPEFLNHLQEHLPLRCSKCSHTFIAMEDFKDIDKCVSLSDLLDISISKSSLNIADERFDSLYEKIINSNEDMEAVLSINKSNKTAVITPIVRRKYLVDYEASDTEGEGEDAEGGTSAPAPKTPRPRRARSDTPHVKKLLMARQHAIDEEDRASPDLEETTPSRVEDGATSEMTTPTSHLVPPPPPALTASTPTHHAHAPATPWALFNAHTESPLSEIETGDSPAQTFDNVTEDTDTSEQRAPRLKSIMSSRVRLGTGTGTFSGDSEQDTRTKRVQFAEDTVFQPDCKVKRVFRKPKRMLTPGPQKPKFGCNPRFQALINRFEQNNQGNQPRSPGSTLARTPVTNRDNPPVEHSVPRAIDFKDSPMVEDSKDSELFKSCVATPEGMDPAISALTANIAGSLQTCITNVLKQTAEETEIQFKFTITKKKMCVKRMADDEAAPEPAREQDGNTNKENLWASVAKAVKQAFWGEEGSETPHQPPPAGRESSSSKRKRQERGSRSPSPLSHKRHKFEPRLRGRPPLRAPLTARLARGDLTSHSF